MSQKLILDAIYPIGIIITMGESWTGFEGQTWTQIAQGRALIGEGTGTDGAKTLTFNAGDTGGKYEHTLTVDEMPSHRHGFSDKNWAPANGGGSGQYRHPFHNPQYTSSNTNYTGGNQAHTIMQPYKVVFYYERTA
jgi:microcystin-dependent protein